MKTSYEEVIFHKAKVCLDEATSKLTELQRKEDELAYWCKNFIKQDIDLSVEYQPSDGFCLLYSDDGNEINVPLTDFLNAVKENGYEKLDIDAVYFV